MATIQMYKKCKKSIKRIGFRDIKSGKLVNIDFKLFGIKSLIDKNELMNLSKSEQRRHKWEDSAMWMVYGNA